MWNKYGSRIKPDCVIVSGKFGAILNLVNAGNETPWSGRWHEVLHLRDPWLESEFHCIAE